MDNINERDHDETRRAHETRLLEQIARGDAGLSILGALCVAVEQILGREVRCAVHLLNDDGSRITRVIAPGFDEGFARSQEVAVSPTTGASAAAAYLRRQIVLYHIGEDARAETVEDASRDPCGFRSICATPVLWRGETLAVFTVYYAQSDESPSEDQVVLDWAIRIASIALGREYSNAAPRRSEDNYRSILDNLSDGVLITQKGVVVYANAAVTELTGRTGSALLGGDFYAMVRTEDAVGLRRRDAMRGCGECVPGICTVQIAHVDGSVRVLQLSDTAVTWDDASSLLFTLTDITERVRVEEDVKLLNSELERRVAERTRALDKASRELEAFSYSISHDLRAPVRSIAGFSDILLKRHAAAMDAEALAHLQRVQRAALRMQEMIDGLLDLARIGRKPLSLETVNLSVIASEILAQLREAAPDRAVEVDVADDIHVHGDRHLLHAVLDNLLRNAWKFTGKTAQARIVFGQLQRDGETVYFVRDNGAGFEMKYAQKLFGAFQRLHRRDEFEGTGVGLATVQRIIASHGGDIWAEAEIGCGACFFFTLARPHNVADGGVDAIACANVGQLPAERRRVGAP